MDLFTKADKQKEFPDSNTVLIHLKSNGKFNVTIHDNFLTVEPRGFTNAVNKGLIGQKTYDLNNVSGVQYKKPGFTTGYLQIVLIGGRDKTTVYTPKNSRFRITPKTCCPDSLTIIILR